MSNAAGNATSALGIIVVGVGVGLLNAVVEDDTGGDRTGRDVPIGG